MQPSTQSLLSGLFRYREREGRSPLEDFLSEALCHFLNLLDEESRTQEALQVLFGIENLHHQSLRWQTQYVIPADVGPPSGKRPDLVGRPPDGRGAIVIIENKIAAPFTEHIAGNGELPAHQIGLYRDYAKGQEKSYAVRLVTHLTAPPAGWDKQTVTWQQIHVVLRKIFTPPSVGKSTPAERFAEELRLFLEENNMAEVKIGLDEIAAYPIWRAFREKIAALGTNWQIFENHPLHETLKNSGLGATGYYGDFHWENCAKFSGTIFTPAIDGKALAATHSNVFLYIGVLVDSVYGCIHPVMDGLPEFTAGLAIWHSDPDQWEEQKRIIRNLRGQLSACNRTWTKRPVKDGRTDVTILAVSKPFLELYHPDSDWIAQADAFYRAALEDMTQIGEKNFVLLAKMQSA